MKKAVLIPVFNAELHIESLIREVKRYIQDIIVVDDGSRDNSASLAEKNGALVIRHKKNSGKGASIRSGINYILDKDYDIIIIMDADGQHKPDEIPKFIEFFEESQIPIIVGNRMQDVENMPRIRRLTNKVMSKVISIICKQYIPDSQCGFRLIKREIFEKIKLFSSNYEIESEILIRSSREGFKIGSVPITTVYSKEISYINPMIDTLRFLKLLIDIYIKK